jgi:predicted Rossmann fold flavoprotein
MTKIAVIGGGASGFMAAVTAAENSVDNTEITIFEKYDPLKKLLLTGGGRCNISNATYNNKLLASNYPRGEKFLYSVFNSFSVQDTINWFENHGVNLYTQDDQRLFPSSDDANTVKLMFLKKAKDLGIKIRTNTTVSKIEYKQDLFYVYANKDPLIYDKVIISTGGNFNNPDNSGYNLAKNLGHQITELKPALTSFKTNNNIHYDLAGVVAKNIKITANFENKRITEESGDMLFTHKGISGPVILKISSTCAFLNYSKSNPLILHINFIPEKNQEEFEKELLCIFDKNSKKSLGNILSSYMTRSLVSAVLNSASINYDKKPSQITKEERKIIINLMTNFKISAIAPVTESEMVTAGGVDLDEINSKTMESKIIKNLYFCGEVLNIDGFTGGFNLQAAWSTGFIAGMNAVKI